MNKFTIENLIIEKSGKDIKTGIKYELSDGINLICGNNEAGKSSLMQFIKQAFFQTKDTDSGKIFFKICDENSQKCYRADIKNSQKKNERCKIFDENNNACSYELIENTINRKYFEQGFTINLDDLMTIQNDGNFSLINVIKDPSGDKLNSYLEQIKLKIKKTLGDNGRLTKDTASILDKISGLSAEIRELSNQENEYNFAVNLIKTLNEDIDTILNKEEYLKILSDIDSLQKELDNLQQKKAHLSLNFNPKLFDNKEAYILIIQNSGKYESNIESIERNKQKSEVLKNKILTGLNSLNTEYALDFNENSIQQIVINPEIINKIKILTAEINNLKNEVLSNNIKIENTDESLLKLKHELIPLEDKNISVKEYTDFLELHRFLQEGLNQYNYLLNKINEADKESKVNAVGIISNRNLLILFGALIFLTIMSAVISFWQKVPAAGIFSVLMAILSLAGFVSLKLGNYNAMNEEQKNRDEELKNNILKSLKDKLRDYYNEIDNIESSYLPLKIENLKQEIAGKIQNYNIINEQITKITANINYNKEKRDNLNKKLENISNEITNIRKDIKNIITSDNKSFEIPEEKYLNVIDIIKSVKDNIAESNTLEEEIQSSQNANNIIIDDLLKFICNNSVNIQVTDKFAENLAKLQEYNEANTDIKNQLDILNIEIENLKNKINKLGEKKNILGRYEQEQILITQEELKALKEEKINQRKEAEFQKRKLENVESLADLKLQKNILTDEYRLRIKELFENKMILALTDIAKANFDKTQPDLINAQKYLSILTDGKYTKINLTLEEIENSDGTKIKKWEELSRGTKEQLYLALRLGYASNYSIDKSTGKNKGKPNLPLIIDDAFVNFDAKRTKNALKCLIEFSKTNQILFFTCHTETMLKRFEELGIIRGRELNIIQL